MRACGLFDRALSKRTLTPIIALGVSFCLRNQRPACSCRLVAELRFARFFALFAQVGEFYGRTEGNIVQFNHCVDERSRGSVGVTGPMLSKVGPVRSGPLVAFVVFAVRRSCVRSFAVLLSDAGMPAQWHVFQQRRLTHRSLLIFAALR
jgi:hypothetical protein